jgi:hypothetical protein
MADATLDREIQETSRHVCVGYFRKSKAAAPLPETAAFIG